MFEFSTVCSWLKFCLFVLIRSIQNLIAFISSVLKHFQFNKLFLGFRARKLIVSIIEFPIDFRCFVKLNGFHTLNFNIQKITIDRDSKCVFQMCSLSKKNGMSIGIKVMIFSIILISLRIFFSTKKSEYTKIGMHFFIQTGNSFY